MFLERVCSSSENPHYHKTSKANQNKTHLALRLFPSVPVNTRTAVKTTILPTGGGPDGLSPVLIRRGENVAYLIYAMHRRKDLYGDDAEEFKPERWEDQSLPLYTDATTSTWGYLPFNGGPRVCLGSKYFMILALNNAHDCFFDISEDFGLIEASYAVVRILQTFPKIEAAPFERPQAQSWLGFSSHQSKGIKMESKERQKMTLVMSPGDGCPVRMGAKTWVQA